VQIDTATARVTRRLALAEGVVQSLRLHKKSLWVGTPNGILEVDPRRGSLIRAIAQLRGKDITSFGFDKVNSIWVGTSQGLFRVDPRNGAIVGQVGSLPSSRVLSVAPDIGNKLWVGTTEGLAWVSMTSYKTTPHQLFSRSNP
jgi:ligand-binding sensor domain-containing protein